MQPATIQYADDTLILARASPQAAQKLKTILSKGGRLTLLSAVLDSLPTHFMVSLLIPLLIVEKLDKKEGPFLGWGGFVLRFTVLSYSRACLPKQSVGLGIKNLHVQNVCLLLKFCFKTLQQDNTPWIHWVSHLSPYPFSHGAQS
jgi:hypothetical protein